VNKSMLCCLDFTTVLLNCTPRLIISYLGHPVYKGLQLPKGLFQTLPKLELGFKTNSCNTQVGMVIILTVSYDIRLHIQNTEKSPCLPKKTTKKQYTIFDPDTHY
jgi:hypothetical protein